MFPGLETGVYSPHDTREPSRGTAAHPAERHQIRIAAFRQPASARHELVSEVTRCAIGAPKEVRPRRRKTKKTDQEESRSRILPIDVVEVELSGIGLFAA